MPRRHQEMGAGFYTRLESLRGLAALSVAAFHASQTPWSAGKTLVDAPYHAEPFWRATMKLLFVLFNGQGAVNLFFVLSGFVLAASIQRGPLKSGPASGRFAVARVFRLFPAIWMTVAVYAIVFLCFGPKVALYPGEITITRIISNMLLLDVSLNGLMWSLQVEVLAIPLILISALMSRRWGILPLLAVAALLFALSFNGHWTRGLHGLSLNPLFCFSLGMLVRHAEPALRGAKKYQGIALLLFSLGLFFSIRAMLGKSTGDFRWITIAEGFAAAIMIGVIAYRKDANLASALDWPVLRFYGRISYSFYLLHPLTLVVAWSYPDQIAAILRWGVPDALVVIALASTSILLATLPAWLSWRYAETPGIALGRRIEYWGGGLFRRSAEPAATMQENRQPMRHWRRSNALHTPGGIPASSLVLNAEKRGGSASSQ